MNRKQKLKARKKNLAKMCEGKPKKLHSAIKYIQEVERRRDKFTSKFIQK